MIIKSHARSRYFFRCTVCIWQIGLVMFLGGMTLPMAVLAAPEAAPIIGGTEAPPAKYPWMAALLAAEISDSTEAQFCGASLIAPQYLATAAHCVAGADPSSIQAMLGQTTLPFGVGDRVNLIGIFVHPEFNFVTLENDVALLKLEQPVNITPLNVLQPGNDSLLTEGSKATIMGWGSTDPKRPILPVNLMEAQIPIHSDKTCLEAIGRFFKPLTMLCAGVLSSSPTSADGKDSCYGDSGGPLIVKTGTDSFSLAGTVGWGFGCADNKSYGVYADVMQLASFLNERPLAPPVITGSLLVNGSGLVGEKLTCTGAALKGDSAESVTYAWYADFFSFLAEGQEYTPQESDVGSFVHCEISASNEGGVTTLSSENEVEIFSNGTSQTPDPNPDPNPEPNPDAAPPTVSKDSTPPSIALFSRGCKKRKCTVVVSVADDSGPAGVASTEALVTKEVQKAECGGAKCLTLSTHSLAGSSDGSGNWSFSVKGPRRGSLKVKFSIRAVDVVGNITVKPFETILRIRRKNS